jgi:CspA family cold shock protein
MTVPGYAGHTFQQKRALSSLRQSSSTRSLDQENVVAKGTVKWFNAQKGYGFIEQADGGKDVFVHVAELAPGVGTLSENQAVEFEVQQAQKGPQAVNVRPV